MKKRLITVFILVFFLSACTSLANNSTSTVTIQQPTVDVQPELEKTREYFAMQTIVALEQLTNTPTPRKLSNTPTPWVIVTTKTQPQLAFATALKPGTPVYQGPGTNYRMACYVEDGLQLIITGRNIDSSWLGVTFSQGQTCYTLNEISKPTIIIPDPTKQFWIIYSMFTVSGNLSKVPTVTPKPYGAAFLWDDRFNNLDQDRALSFEHKSFPISYTLTGVGLIIWLGMIFRSTIALSRRQRSLAHKPLYGILHFIAGLW